jgi:hypothetical protein
MLGLPFLLLVFEGVGPPPRRWWFRTFKAEWRRCGERVFGITDLTMRAYCSRGIQPSQRSARKKSGARRAILSTKPLNETSDPEALVSIAALGRLPYIGLDGTPRSSREKNRPQVRR